MNKDMSENENKVVEETTLYNADRLMGISVQAKAVSWIVLTVSILFMATYTIDYMQSFWDNAYGPRFDDLPYYFLGLLPGLLGLFLYIILRALAEGIYLFMDIEIGLRELKGQGK